MKQNNSNLNNTDENEKDLINDNDNKFKSLKRKVYNLYNIIEIQFKYKLFYIIFILLLIFNLYLLKKNCNYKREIKNSIDKIYNIERKSNDMKLNSLKTNNHINGVIVFNNTNSHSCS